MTEDKTSTLESLMRSLVDIVAPPVFIIIKIREDGFAELHGISKTLNGLRLLSERSDKDNPHLDYVG
jgi:hypothetical protein